MEYPGMAATYTPIIEDRRKAQNRLAQRRRRQKNAAAGGVAPAEPALANGSPTPSTSVSFDLEALGECPVPWAVPATPLDNQVNRPSRIVEPASTAADAQIMLQAWRDSTSELWQRMTPPPNEVPRFSNGRNETLIHTAARQSDIATMQVLVEHGFSVNARDGEGRTALHVAIETSDKEVILWLLEHGIDINAVDDHGRTALSMVVNNACPTAVRLFLVHGAEFTNHSQMGKSTLAEAGNAVCS